MSEKKTLLDSSWVDFNIEIMSVSEKDLVELLQKEREGKNRKTVIQRIKQRLSKIASDRAWNQ